MRGRQLAPDLGTLVYHARLVVDLTDVQQTKIRAFAPVASWEASRAGNVSDIPAEHLDPVAFGPVNETVRRWLAVGRLTPTVDFSAHLAEAVWIGQQG